MNITDLKFRSKKQELSVRKKLNSTNAYSKYNIHNQWADGSITLHHFFQLDSDWLGYALTVGARGGEKAYHKCFVIENTDGSLELHHS